MQDNTLLTSAEFAKEIGVSVVTLARWEETGILKPYLKTPTGRRKYIYAQVKEYFEAYQIKEG